MNKNETDLLNKYVEKEGWHSAISTMFVLGLIPYLNSVPGDEIIAEMDLCVKEINSYLKETCFFTGRKLINKELKNEILASEFNLKKEIA